MARYRIAKDGHRFLTHGYAILDKQAGDDVRFSTYQVNTGGERVFDRTGFEDGDRVSEETFFALLLDGDLYNDARPNGIGAAALPNRILVYMESAVQQYHLEQINIEGEVYLADILERLRPQFKNALEALSPASWLCIFRYRKIHAAKQRNAVKERNRNAKPGRRAIIRSWLELYRQSGLTAGLRELVSAVRSFEKAG